MKNIILITIMSMSSVFGTNELMCHIAMDTSLVMAEKMEMYAKKGNHDMVRYYQESTNLARIEASTYCRQGSNLDRYLKAVDDYILSNLKELLAVMKGRKK